MFTWSTIKKFTCQLLALQTQHKASVLCKQNLATLQFHLLLIISCKIATMSLDENSATGSRLKWLTVNCSEIFFGPLLLTRELLAKCLISRIPWFNAQFHWTPQRATFDPFDF